jgi:outer membrane protein W
MAFQAGVDMPITDKLSLNFSTSFLDIDTKAWTQLRSDGELFEGNTALRLRKNPNVSVLGISYRL